MIRKEIEIQELTDLTTIRRNIGMTYKGRDRYMSRLWYGVKVYEVFKRSYYGYNMKVCVKINGHRYIVMEYIGGAYLPMEERRWMYL